jgi:uncharacterized SAM-binding protein YcdF (DUF218 family)
VLGDLGRSKILNLINSKNKFERKSKRKLKLYLLIFFLVIILVLGSIIPIKLAIAFYQQPEPQAVLVLGGSKMRIRLATKFFKTHPELEIWISDYFKKLPINQEILERAGIVGAKVHYDICATDTVTNFTCTVDDFTQRNIRHVYVLTSDYHIARAQVIAFFVLGSRGIAFTPVSVASRDTHSESNLKNIRDSLRSILWILTGKSGASLNYKLKQID